MEPRLKMSQDGLELLKSFEGLRLTAARLPDGRWTMGHGHTQHARDGAVITAEDAEALLRYDLIPVVAAVNDAVTETISQRQFDALACFAFNVGVDAFLGSDVLARVNQGRMTEAALAMAIWRSGAFNGSSVVLDALIRRRSAEEALLLGGEPSAAPTDLIRPQIDEAARAALPAVQPGEVLIDFEAPAAEAVLQPAAVETQPAEAESEEPTFLPPVFEPAEAQASEVAEPATVETVTPEPETAPVEALEPETVEPEPASAQVYEAEPQIQLFHNYLPERLSPPGPVEAAEPTPPEPVVLDMPDEVDQVVSYDGEEPPLVLILTPPPEVPFEPHDDEPEGEASEDSGPGQDRLFEADAESPLSESLILREETEPAEAKALRWSETAAYFGAGAVGLFALGAGVAGFRMAQDNPAPDGAFDEKSVIAWVLVLIGVVCLWVASYNLFRRLGGSRD